MDLFLDTSCGLTGYITDETEGRIRAKDLRTEKHENRLEKRINKFMRATSFARWAQGRVVRIRGCDFPVTLENVHKYLRLQNCDSRALFSKYVSFTRDECLIIQFGASFNFSFRDVWNEQSALVYSPYNEYERFEEVRHSRYFFVVEREWKAKISSWVEYGWIDEERKIELFEQFDAIYLSEEAADSEVDFHPITSPIFEERDSSVTPELPAIFIPISPSCDLEDPSAKLKRSSRKSKTPDVFERLSQPKLPLIRSPEPPSAGSAKTPSPPLLKSEKGVNPRSARILQNSYRSQGQ